MKIVEMVLNEEIDRQGVYAVSVVNSPAIEEDWVALNRQYVELKSVDDDKRILMGAALVPNKQIYRKDKENGEFYIYFSSQTIRKASELFLKRNKQNNATYEHMKEIDGMSVVESWIIEDEDKDKSKLYGFSLPVGTWMISMKVDNDEVWGKVKEGEIKGFSIEGYFESKTELSKDESVIDEIVNILKSIQ
jgi:hypothetical protein